MTSKRKYRAIAVKHVDVKLALQDFAADSVSIGIDIAKNEVLAVARDESGRWCRPWKAKQPSELRVLVERLQEVGQSYNLVVGMESTGTYGDALRQALTDAGLEVHRVSGKAKSDYEEIFDGVPSAHDGKDAAIIAELVGIGKSKPWSYISPSEEDADMAMLVEWLDAQQDIAQIWLGRLEAKLARHWPELTKLLALNSRTLLRLLAHYGSPAAVREDEGAAAQLQRWGGPFLAEKKIEAICASAKSTVGVRMTKKDQEGMQRYATAALQAVQEIKKAKAELAKHSQQDESLQAVASIVGPTTACILAETVGDPNDYHCAEAYRKALGLNLKERSSGQHKGKLKITKRGPSIARRWLYFAALRLVQQPGVRPWYEAKKKKDQGFGGRALVAVMRKLALAIWHVAVHKKPFEPWRLFPGSRLPRNAVA